MSGRGLLMVLSRILDRDDDVKRLKVWMKDLSGRRRSRDEILYSPFRLHFCSSDRESVDA